MFVIGFRRGEVPRSAHRVVVFTAGPCPAKSNESIPAGCSPGSGLIMQSPALENLFQIFLNARGTGFGLLGRGKIEQIGPLPSGG